MRSRTVRQPGILELFRVLALGLVISNADRAAGANEAPPRARTAPASAATRVIIAEIQRHYSCIGPSVPIVSSASEIHRQPRDCVGICLSVAFHGPEHGRIADYCRLGQVGHTVPVNESRSGIRSTDISIEPKRPGGHTLYGH